MVSSLLWRESNDASSALQALHPTAQAKRRRHIACDIVRSQKLCQDSAPAKLDPPRALQNLVVALAHNWC